MKRLLALSHGLEIGMTKVLADKAVDLGIRLNRVHDGRTGPEHLRIYHSKNEHLNP